MINCSAVNVHLWAHSHAARMAKRYSNLFIVRLSFWVLGIWEVNLKWKAERADNLPGIARLCRAVNGRSCLTSVCWFWPAPGTVMRCSILRESRIWKTCGICPEFPCVESFLQVSLLTLQPRHWMRRLPTWQTCRVICRVSFQEAWCGSVNPLTRTKDQIHNHSYFSSCRQQLKALADCGGKLAGFQVFKITRSWRTSER